MSQVAEDTLQAGREAAERHAWRDAFERLTEADQDGNLSPADLESLAEAAWWTAHPDQTVDALERAYAAYMEEGNNLRAASVATRLAWEHFNQALPSVAGGWLRRAGRLLEGEADSPERGYLERLLGLEAWEGDGGVDRALQHAARTLEIGMQFGDRDLQALALHDQGRILVAQGQVADGMALIDEATVAAVSGEVSPLTTGIIYCNVISTCEDIADYRRAGEWTDATKRWCERRSISGFPGICRVRRAEIMRLRGAWAEAEGEARQACDELHQFKFRVHEAAGFYEIGEIRLRMGDLEAAEEAFRQAHELGRNPEPGLSLLNLALGKPGQAATSIRRALEDSSLDDLVRARLIPAQVKIALAAGDIGMASGAAEEMRGIADIYQTVALEAAALEGLGAVQTARGEAEEAVETLRHAWKLWQEIDLPYEASTARVTLAQAYQSKGDGEAAVLELQAARSAFRRLGAAPDARAVDTLLKALGVESATPVAVRSRPKKTFMFTDIVQSTDFAELIGDRAWQNLLDWHDRTLRTLFAEHHGEEIDHTGDGFFVAFEEAASAIQCAVAIQRRLAEQSQDHGFSPQVRIGLHATRASQRGHDYSGRGVHEAQRIAALAKGEEILASAATLEGIPPAFPASPPRSVRVKGIRNEIQVVGVDWR